MYYIIENLKIDKEGVPSYDYKFTNSEVDVLNPNDMFVFMDNHPFPFLLNADCLRCYGDKEKFTLKEAFDKQAFIAGMMMLKDMNIDIKKLEEQLLAEEQKEQSK